MNASQDKGGTMFKHVIVWDIICFVVFPLVIWNVGRDIFGDYYAMLISSIPGIIYSIIRFVLIKRVNVFGIFMILNLVIGTLIDVLAGSAIQLLWNNVFYSYSMGFLFLFTLLIKKPLPLYFLLDFSELQGYDRKEIKELCYQRKVYRTFIFITLVFIFQDFLSATIRLWLVIEYGVDAYDKGIIIRNVISWIFTGICTFGYIRVVRLLKEA